VYFIKNTHQLKESLARDHYRQPRLLKFRTYAVVRFVAECHSHIYAELKTDVDNAQYKTLPLVMPNIQLAL
jgi:hypothetical protein